jgi:hypothetical protein
LEVETDDDVQQLLSRNTSIQNDSWHIFESEFLQDTLSNIENDDDDECDSVFSFDSLEYYDRKGML